jgi:signal transduction histidine kinase
MRFSLNRKSARRPRGALLVLFLVLSLVLAAGLAYQAVDAARSHRETAESVLRDYARVAAWEFSRRAEGALGSAIWPAFTPLREMGAPAPGAPIPAPELIARAHANDTCGCAGMGSPTSFFVLDLADGRMRFAPTPPQRRLSERLTKVLTAEAARPREPGSGQPRLLADTARTGVELVAYALLEDRTGAARAVYGFTAEYSTFQGVFDHLCQEPLLPPSIAGDEPNDSLLYMRVVAPDGGTMYESAARYDEEFTVDDTLQDRLGGLVARATLRPEAASRLVIGGLPRSRLPLILGLLLLAGGVGAASLVQIRRERELARLRDDFVSGVSHELRTPLAQIQMFAELLEDGKLRTEAEQRRSIRILRQESQRLTHLIENVLRFSRSRRLPAQLARTRTDLQRLIDETVESFRPLADARDVKLATENRAAPSVTADPAVLRQILINLLDNAVKYGPAGQTVTVGAARVNGVVRVWVSDQGPGVPPADRERIWEPYLRLERDANGAVGGSGIGLAVVREMAIRHGGGVRVEDAPGGGASFVIELPAEGAGAGPEGGNGTAR